jgi:signal recognition particle GTPase
MNSVFDIADKENKKNAYDKIAYMLAVLLKEDTRLHNKKNPDDKLEEITEETIREEILTHDNSIKVAALILKALRGTMPKKEDEDDDPNLKSEQMKK